MSNHALETIFDQKVMEAAAMTTEELRVISDVVAIGISRDELIDIVAEKLTEEELRDAF
jgi:DNA-binding transcriptional regulator YhcF (GntR family)